MSEYSALSPLDGRYQHKLTELKPLLSEYALMRFRILVEIRWLQALAANPSITELAEFNLKQIRQLDQIFENFNAEEAATIKSIERKTNHDVKAVEYFLQQKITKIDGLEKIPCFIHFACTSEDINNLAYALMLKTAREEVLLPYLMELQHKLGNFAKQHANQAMLSRTHGQTASPTTTGKEFYNFLHRLNRQSLSFASISIRGKINGAVGNFNAHRVAYPEINWPKFAEGFVSSLGLEFNSHTTQIENHDYIAELLHNMARINTVLIDLSRDCWGYISLGYLQQKMIEDEVGSSTMPHKVNPIDFENAEGNLGLANAIGNFLSQQLPTSRWQRDLVDSTLMRNLGVVFGHSLLAYQSLLKGLSKLDVNKTVIENDLNQAWEVLAEPVQTLMRRYGITDAYEQLKAFTRGQIIDEKRLKQFISGLGIPEEAKSQLLALRPESYIGLAKELSQ